MCICALSYTMISINKLINTPEEKTLTDIKTKLNKIIIQS